MGVYRIITYDDRKKIESMFSEGKSVSYVAKEIGICRDTLYKELRRHNMTRDTYNAEIAQHGC